MEFANRAEVILRGLDALVTESLVIERGNNRSLVDHFRMFLSSREASKCERMRAGVCVFSALTPGLRSLIRALTITFDELPLKRENLNFVGYGFEQSVFQLGDRWVAKFNKGVVGKSMTEILKEAERIRGAYFKTRNRYREIPGFILEEYHLICPSFLLGLPTLVTVQPFVRGKVKGVFEDFTFGEVIGILNNSTDLRNQFLRFADLTLESWNDGQGWCIDFVGERNLSLVEGDGPKRLLFWDAHTIFTQSDLPKLSDVARNRLLRGIKQIEMIASELRVKEAIEV